MPTSLTNQRSPLRRLLRYNATTTSFPALTGKAPALLDATGTIAPVDISTGAGAIGVIVPEGLRTKFKPFGAGTDTQTFSMRVYGAHQLLNATGQTGAVMWSQPEPIIEVSCALDDDVAGLAGGTAVAADYYCSALTLVGSCALDYDLLNPQGWAADTAASFWIHNASYQLLIVTFDMTGATSGNTEYGPC